MLKVSVYFFAQLVYTILSVLPGGIRALKELSSVL
jgi:hypothetical protein